MHSDGPAFKLALHQIINDDSVVRIIVIVGAPRVGVLHGLPLEGGHGLGLNLLGVHGLPLGRHKTGRLGRVSVTKVVHRHSIQVIVH